LSGDWLHVINITTSKDITCGVHWSSTDKIFWADTDVFHLSLPITDADTDVFALVKPQLKDITVHFFLQYVGHINKINIYLTTQVTIMKEQIVIVRNRHSWSYFAFSQG